MLVLTFAILGAIVDVLWLTKVVPVPSVTFLLCLMLFSSVGDIFNALARLRHS